MNPIDLPQTPLPQTPLQQALQQPGADALLERHRLRLLQLERHCRLELQCAHPPADHALWRDRLAMCEAALRVLGTQVPAAALPSTAARGPAATWLPLPT